MEVSSHALALHRVDGTAFDVVAFTNLSQDHLDFHADLDDYFEAKARLFTSAVRACGRGQRRRRVRAPMLGVTEIPLTTVSATSRDAHWWVSDLSFGSGPAMATDVPTSSSMGPTSRPRCRSSCPGAFNVANALLAFATLVVAGVDPEAAAAGIAGVSVVPGRMEAVSVRSPSPRSSTTPTRLTRS